MYKSIIFYYLKRCLYVQTHHGTTLFGIKIHLFFLFMMKKRKKKIFVNLCTLFFVCFTFNKISASISVYKRTKSLYKYRIQILIKDIHIWSLITLTLIHTYTSFSYVFTWEIKINYVNSLVKNISLTSCSVESRIILLRRLHDL